MSRPQVPAVGDFNWGEVLRSALFDISDRADASASAADTARVQAVSAADTANSALQTAQATQTQLQNYINSGGGTGTGTGTGINESTLTQILNDSTTTAGVQPARGILDYLVGFRTRTLSSGSYTGAWQSRPNLPIVITIGIAPRPNDMGPNDPFFEPASTA